MASQRSHVAVSSCLGIAYAAVGIALFRVHPEFALLSAVLVLAAGVLPNIDNGPSSPSGQELSGFLAALAPLIVMELYPHLRSGGVARIVLVVLVCYMVSRIIFLHFLKRYAKSRGLLHSIPAAILTCEAVYLLFWDLLPFDRLFLAGGALIGYGSHLLLDAFANFDLTGTTSKKPPALKLGLGNWTTNTVVYSTVIVLGWIIAKDLFPAMQIRNPINL